MLKDKIVLVTGSAQGIGLGIARAILESGGRVAISDLDQAMLIEVRDSLSTELKLAKDQIFATVIDVTDENSITEALMATQDHFGALDGLVNNAGVIRMGADMDASADDWRLQMNVNVIGTHNCCQAFAKQLIGRHQAGAIVNIASNAGKVGYPNMAGYNASKAAVINLTRTLSAELSEHNINVNAICPGGVYTPMLLDVARVVGERIGEDPAELVKTMVPAQLGRHIETIEIGRVAAFLLSDSATIIRGQSINADGGDTPY
ncbi:MAG: NAD(P)-dependent dehydrogenase (short-subunit alcohol dehydrogenase family) [Planctomycetota bacterium]|jgi:NAD(P)-dependent dehydrogenase (short-subunit alcohol dehydrogenase family)